MEATKNGPHVVIFPFIFVSQEGNLYLFDQNLGIKKKCDTNLNSSNDDHNYFNACKCKFTKPLQGRLRLIHWKTQVFYAKLTSSIYSNFQIFTLTLVHFMLVRVLTNISTSIEMTF